MRRCNPLNRRIKQIKALIGDNRSNIRGDAAARIGFVNDDQPICFF